jgi:ABC-type nitrate/sulfonate/bicarbonate transport system substrate-binding protein
MQLAFALVILLVALAAPLAAAQESHQISLGAFGGGFNLPNWVAEKKGFFAREGLKVNITYTRGSAQLIADMADGKVHIYMGLADNVVAYREGQGEAKAPNDFDLTILFGVSSGFASIISAPDVKTLSDLKGKRVCLDALTTGYAFIIRDLLERAGVGEGEGEVTFIPAGGTDVRFKALMDGKSEATITLAPFDSIAVERGHHRLVGATEAYGAYQGTVAAARASWAREHRAAVVAFTRAFKAAIDWLYDPTNRMAALATLAAGEPQLPPAQIEQSFNSMTGSDGFFRDLKPSDAGLKRVLALREKYGKPQKVLADPGKYVDLSYYAAAMKGGRQ